MMNKFSGYFEDHGLTGRWLYVGITKENQIEIDCCSEGSAVQIFLDIREAEELWHELSKAISDFYRRGAVDDAPGKED